MDFVSTAAQSDEQELAYVDIQSVNQKQMVSTMDQMVDVSASTSSAVFQSQGCLHVHMQ